MDAEGGVQGMLCVRQGEVRNESEYQDVVEKNCAIKRQILIPTPHYQQDSTSHRLNIVCSDQCWESISGAAIDST